MSYHVPSIIDPVMDLRGHCHYQYNTIVLVKVQLAKQCKTTKKTAKTRPLELYKVASSQGMTSSPSVHCGRMCDIIF